MNPSILLIEDSPGEYELFRLALGQTGLDVVLYAEHDVEAALHFLNDRYHRSSNQAPSYFPQESGLSWSPTMRIEQPVLLRGGSASTETMPGSSPSSASLQEGSLNPSPPAQVERGPSEAARSASTGDRSGYPSLILLDLHLYGQNGCDFLKRLRSDARLAHLPAIVFTTSDDPRDLATCYASGANGYVVKPGTFDEFIKCLGDLCRFWLNWNRILHKVETRC